MEWNVQGAINTWTAHFVSTLCRILSAFGVQQLVTIVTGRCHLCVAVSFTRAQTFSQCVMASQMQWHSCRAPFSCRSRSHEEGDFFFPFLATQSKEISHKSRIPPETQKAYSHQESTQNIHTEVVIAERKWHCEQMYLLIQHLTCCPSLSAHPWRTIPQTIVCARVLSPGIRSLAWRNVPSAKHTETISFACALTRQMVASPVQEKKTEIWRKKTRPEAEFNKPIFLHRVSKIVQKCSFCPKQIKERIFIFRRENLSDTGQCISTLYLSIAKCLAGTNPGRAFCEVIKWSEATVSKM